MSESIEKMLVVIMAQKSIRAAEMKAAAVSPGALGEQIGKDCAHVVASICGYNSPLFGPKKEDWVSNAMNTDPQFVSKVECLRNLVLEYANLDTYQRREEIDRLKAENAALKEALREIAVHVNPFLDKHLAREALRKAGETC